MQIEKYKIEEHNRCTSEKHHKASLNLLPEQSVTGMKIIAKIS